MSLISWRKNDSTDAYRSAHIWEENNVKTKATAKVKRLR
jgi:hypothetical protein